MQKLAHSLIVMYAALIVLWFGLRPVLGDSVWWMALLNNLAAFLFVPLPLVVVGALASRRPWLIVNSLVPLAIFAWLYTPLMMPRLAGDDRPADVRVMTYNVLFSNTDYRAVANVIRSQKPDLVALQEVQPAMMLNLINQLRDLYPYSSLGVENSYGTTAVLSRHLLLDTRSLDLEADRPAVVARLRIGETELTFISAHLLPYDWRMVPLTKIPQLIADKTAQQNRQVAILLQEMATADGPVILACDCNTKVTSTSYQMLLDAEMTSAQRAVPWPIGRTKPEGVSYKANLSTSDHILYRGPLRAIGAYEVQDVGGSDHAPFLVEFRVEG